MKGGNIAESWRLTYRRVCTTSL